MSEIADIYRGEILRAVYGPYRHEGKVHDLHRLNQFAEHLAECEKAQEILRAKGYGRSGMSFVEIVRCVPENVRQVLKNIFKPPAASSAPYPDIGEIHDIWTSR